jgi:hypothetical protein
MKSRLAFVPQPMADESSLGYLARLCQANAFDFRHILTGVCAQCAGTLNLSGSVRPSDNFCPLCGGDIQQ